MIFRTYQELDKVSGTVSQKVDFAPGAIKKQLEFDKTELEPAIKKRQDLIKKYKEAYDSLRDLPHQEKHAKAMAVIDADADDDVRRYLNNVKDGKVDIDEFGEAQREAYLKGKSAWSGLSASFKAMAASIGAELAVMLALQAVMWGLNKLNEEFHITAASKVEAMENAVNNYNDALEQSGDNISTIKGLQDEFATLARGVNDAGENVGLSADEYERYHEIVDELVKMNPELVQTYDKEGNAIIDRNTAIEKGIELQEEYQDKITRDYINSGDDILKGARVNINDALEDARKQAGEMGEVGDLAAQTFGQAFAATLKGEAEPGAAGDILLENIYNAFNGEALLGGGPNFNDVVSDYLGREVDLAKSSISTLRQVDEEFDAIIANAKAEGYSDTALQKISDQYQSFHDSLVDIDTAYQPIKDWLTAVVNEADEAGNTIASSIPEEMSAGFTAGLEQIAYEGGTADQMKTKAEELAETLQAISRGEMINGIDTEVSVKLEDGTKVVTTYQKALEEAEKAKEDFDDSNRDSDAVEDYNEAVETEVKVLNALADEWEDVDAAVAESLRSQANAINSYASENIMTLTEALNPLADKFEEARGAKERFDAAMEASGDYDTAIDSFKEVYDEIMTSENTAGNGSIALNTGAVQILGQDRVFELGSIDEVKKELKNIKPILEGSESGARAFFERLRDCEDALNKVSDGAVTVDETTGKVSFDFDEDKWAEYARAMGVSVEVLSAAVDNARQFADIDLGNLETIKSSIMDMDGSIIKKNGKEVYQSLQNFRTAALAAGYGFEEINDRVEDLKDEGVHLIDLTADAVTLAESLASLGSEYGLAQDSDKNGIYEIDAEKTITQMFAWGESVDSVRNKVTELLEATENGDIELNFEKPDDVSWEDWIEDLKAQFDIQFGEAEDPFSKMASSADKFTDAVNNLIVALGHLPDNYEIGTNFDEIAADLDNLAKNENLSDNQKDNLTNSITAGIDSAKAEIEKYKNLLKSGDLTKDQKLTLEADIKDAEDKVKIFEAVLEDLQDGELTEFTFNAKTGNFEPVVEHVQEKTEETPTFWQTEFNADDGNVEGVTDSVLTSINEVPFNPNVEFTASIAQGFNNIVQKVKDKIQSAINFANEAMGWSSTPNNSSTSGHHTPSGDGSGHLGTPQSPNYRAHSSFPSMAKGGRLGPRGNGGLTLTGELGTELVWIPSESRSFLVGQYGPEMVDLPGDAVVYPADQTRKILGDTISPGRLRFGTGSLARGNIQFGSMGDAGGSMVISSTSSTRSSKTSKKSVKASVDAYEKAVARLDHLLEMGYISESTYYQRLCELYDQHESALKKDTEAYREAQEAKKQARIDAYEGEKEILDSKLNRGVISEQTYYNRLLALGQKYYTEDGKIRKGYYDEWCQWQEDLQSAEDNLYDSKLNRLDYLLEMGIISWETYFRRLKQLNDDYADTFTKEEQQEADLAERQAWIDGYETKKGTLDSKLDRGVINQQTYYNNLLSLGKKYYTKDGKIRKGYLEEWRQWQSDLQEAEDNLYASKKDLLDHQLEMGYISAETYYKRLEKLNDNFAKTFNTEEKRNAKLEEKNAWIDAYEGKKETLDSRLDRGVIDEGEYYNSLLALGKKYYTKDGKIRKGYLDEWRQWQSDLINAKQDAFDTEQEQLDEQLEKGLISWEEYFKKSTKLRNKYLTGKALSDDKKDAADDAFEATLDAWEKIRDEINQGIDDFELGLSSGIDPDAGLDELKAHRADIAKLLNNNAYKNYFNEIKEYLLDCDREIAEFEKSLAEERQDELNGFMDLVERLVRQEANDYIDALNDQKDSFDDLIDKRKEMLRLAEEEASFQEEIEDGNREMAKIQQQIDLLSRDDSRAARAKVAELQEELAELQRDQNATIRDETISRAEDVLDKQSELYGEIIDRQIEVVENWLNNKSAVLEVVVKEIENRDENDLFDRLVGYNGEFGNGLLQTVNDAWGDIEELTEIYGDDVATIVEILQKGIDINIKGGLISPDDTDYEETQYNTKYPTYHSGLASGFTGNGANIKQNEVWRLLTDDELVLNKEDQMRLGQSMQILDSIKSSYSNLNRAIDFSEVSGMSNIEIIVEAPINIQGSTTPDMLDQIGKIGDQIANSTFDKLQEALMRHGIKSGISTSAGRISMKI